MSDRPTARGDESTTSAPRIDVFVTPPDSEEARAAERDLDSSGVPIALTSRPAYHRYLGRPGAVSLIARNEPGRHLAMLTLASVDTRALPGHRLFRIEAVGDEIASPSGAALLERAVQLAATQSRVLRLAVELECRLDSSREYLGAVLQRLGLSRIAGDRVSGRTLAIDLTPTEEQILAGFGRSTRQHIRAVEKLGLTLQPLDDPTFGPRMNQLLDLALKRTGGVSTAEDWNAIMRLCAARPDRSRVVGLLTGGPRHPDQLLGYAWGLHHGDRVEYHIGASTRSNLKIGILAPVLWDLIAWGRRHGGRWFDLGGVSAGSAGSGDRLGGISDFKRGFSKEEITLGEEWAFEPRPLRWRLASLNSRLAKWLRAQQKKGRAEPPVQ